jgi:Uma2 family endonuclease
MKPVEANKTYTISEYILLEEAGEIRHEFINGNLIEISGASREHHKMCKRLLAVLELLLTDLDYEVYIENMKVAIPGENQFYYPDIMVTNETETDQNRYVQYEPTLIAEVLSETTLTKDIVDKFIQYRKIPSLQYYLLVQPEKPLVICYFKNANNEWDMLSYTQMDEIINLPKLELSFSLQKLYTRI